VDGIYVICLYTRVIYQVDVTKHKSIQLDMELFFFGGGSTGNVEA
jgi:hypothetical protein